MRTAKLSPEEVAKIRKRWNRDSAFLGSPDAERDSQSPEWLSRLLTRPHWFNPATERKTTIVVGRKGVGKSASRIASIAQARAHDGDMVAVTASADELASRHASRLQAAAERGFGAVNDWIAIFAELLVHHAAREMTGRVITSDDDEAVRKWAIQEGITERDFGERVASALKGIAPWAEKMHGERVGSLSSDWRFRRYITASKFALYIDDFDNLQEAKGLANMRLIRDALEAADRVTHQASHQSSVHLLLRQDLWLRLRPGWHYADKVAGLAQLNWTQDDLRHWIDRRLRNAVGEALGLAQSELPNFEFGALWNIFFPQEVRLFNDKTSSGFHYIVRRTMYTPRSLRHFLQLVVERARQLPADQRDVEDAEEEFAADQLEYLKTEFGGLCAGLDVCLDSFTGRVGETIASALYKHLNGLIGNGQVRLESGVSDSTDAVGLARFLYRIGFLEVRYPDGSGGYEVRDAMRDPDHWKSIRRDDSVNWAVRSAFFVKLRNHHRTL